MHETSITRWGGFGLVVPSRTRCHIIPYLLLTTTHANSQWSNLCHLKSWTNSSLSSLRFILSKQTKQSCSTWTNPPLTYSESSTYCSRNVYRIYIPPCAEIHQQKIHLILSSFLSFPRIAALEQTYPWLIPSVRNIAGICKDSLCEPKTVAVL